MKKFLKQSLAFLLVAVLLVPMCQNGSTATVYAAKTPSFSKSKVTISGTGETYQLSIKNKIAKSKYKWSSSDTKIAKVTSKGLVTSVKGGTVNIKCKITYPSKKTKTLSCKVTVRIPATGISITTPALENGAYKITVGNTVDFNTVLTPANSTDKTYWEIDPNAGGTPDCIRIDDAAEGKITAMKAGKASLRVKACKTATKAEADKSDISAAVILEVVAPKAQVNSADITGNNEITIVFDSPVQKSTLIDANGNLSPNVSITLGKDVKNVLASDPGKLTPSLSSDNKTLTITTTNALKGAYYINVTKSVLTTSGVAIEEYQKLINYADSTAPTYINTTLDDTGMIATINFSEAMNFTNMQVTNAKCTSSATYSANSISVISNAMNYKPSADKKSLTINLSTIAPADYGKIFTVVLSGITDLAGNYPATAYIQPTLCTDAMQKPQATPIIVERTGYDKLTATFDRAIKTPGILQINGGTIPGEIDLTDSKKVNYTLPSYASVLTGNVTVYLYNWNSYNVVSSDTSASQGKSFQVSFATDTTAPVLLSNTFDSTTNNLKLTYNEPVVLASASGVLGSQLRELNNDIIAQNIPYTAVSDSNDNVITINLGNVNVLGTYSINLPNGFVTDNFKNACASGTISISNLTDSSKELPPPFSIAQSTDNLSQINVYFANKLDEASAKNINNYSIAGVTLLSASIAKNTSSGAIVTLTAADASIAVTIARPVTISGIMGYDGSFNVMSTYKTTVTLVENEKPHPVTTAYDYTSNTVKITFNEEITGSITAAVTQSYNGSNTAIGSSISISGSTVLITLNSVPPKNSSLSIAITSNSIQDKSGNTCAPISTLGAVVSY